MVRSEKIKQLESSLGKPRQMEIMVVIEIMRGEDYGPSLN